MVETHIVQVNETESTGQKRATVPSGSRVRGGQHIRVLSLGYNYPHLPAEHKLCQEIEALRRHALAIENLLSESSIPRQYDATVAYLEELLSIQRTCSDLHQRIFDDFDIVVSEDEERKIHCTCGGCGDDVIPRPVMTEERGEHLVCPGCGAVIDKDGEVQG